MGWAHRLSSSLACGILVPQPGIEPVFPALQGGILTTGPPGKSQNSSSYRLIYCLLKDPTVSSVVFTKLGPLLSSLESPWWPIISWGGTTHQPAGSCSPVRLTVQPSKWWWSVLCWLGSPRLPGRPQPQSRPSTEGREREFGTQEWTVSAHCNTYSYLSDSLKNKHLNEPKDFWEKEVQGRFEAKCCI